MTIEENNDEAMRTLQQRISVKLHCAISSAEATSKETAKPQHRQRKKGSNAVSSSSSKNSTKGKQIEKAKGANSQHSDQRSTQPRLDYRIL